MESAMSISELADAAGLTRRAVRFYVQQKLLPAPNGLGRGKHYDASHLERIRQIRQLQLAGHSLEEIRHILDGGGVPPSAEVPVSIPPAPRAPVSVVRAELWRRLRISEGLELSFDATRFNPSVEDLMRLRDTIAAVFRNDNENDTQTI
jgi:DNA-binding transcriptional MerR regulator